jgi:hypothetical protein
MRWTGSPVVTPSRLRLCIAARAKVQFPKAQRKSICPIYRRTDNADGRWEVPLCNKGDQVQHNI